MSTVKVTSEGFSDQTPENILEFMPDPSENFYSSGKTAENASYRAQNANAQNPGGLFTWLEDLTTNAAANVGIQFYNVAGEVSSGIKHTANQVVDAAGNTVNEISNFAGNAANQVTKPLQSIVDQFNDGYHFVQICIIGVLVITAIYVIKGGGKNIGVLPKNLKVGV